VSEPLDLSPFPPLEWDGWEWRGAFQVPWYVSPETPELVVRRDPKKVTEEISDPAAAPRPSAAQQAAFEALLQPDPPLKQPLLAEFVRYIPELERPDWESVQAFFELAHVRIFHTSVEDVAYAGFVFNCLQWDYGYEHGVGIVTHKDRVVHFGMAEEAEEEAAMKDVRRLARAAKKSPR
jgi:hypothetical protein